MAADPSLDPAALLDVNGKDDIPYMKWKINENKKNVWNHQPENITPSSRPTSSMPSEITLQTAEDWNSAYFRESMLLLSMLFGGVISVFPWKIISQEKNMTNKWFRTQLSHRSSLSDPPYWISLSHLKLSCFFEVYLLWFYHNPQSFSISSWLDSPIHHP